MDLASAAASLAACIGQGAVPEALAEALLAEFPHATFLRLSLRCGSGLFVTENLLRPGACALALVSLQSSMAGAVMKEGRPISLDVAAAKAERMPAAACGGSTARVVCYPIGVEPASPRQQGQQQQQQRTSYIGALQVGLAAAAAVAAEGAAAHAQLEALCVALGPYLLLVSLTKVQDIVRVMQLPLAECACCSGEEELELDDAPFGTCADDLSRGGPPGGAAPAQTAANPAASRAGAADADADAAGPSSGESSTRSSWEHDAAAGGGGRELRYRGLRLDKASSGEGKGPPSPFESMELSAHKAKQAQQAVAAEGFSEEGKEGGAEADADDPKAAARRAGRRAAAAGLRQGVLLGFADRQLEARFRRGQALELRKLDLLFHLIYLVAFACTTLLDPSGVLRAPNNIWLAWVLGVPALCIVACADWYVRWRSWVCVPLALLRMAHYRWAAAPALLQALPATALRKLPWLLRCTGAEALLVFPLGNKLPFSIFLPLQLASVAAMLTLLPAPCRALAALAGCASEGCLPAGWSLRCGAALLGVGFVLPTCAVYFVEARARSRFAQLTAQRMAV